MRVRSWGHVGDQPQDRLDIVAGEQLEPGARPSQVDVRDIDVQLEPPPPDAVDPARAWRDENPYRSWWRHFGWTRIDPISAQDAVPEPVEPVAAPQPRLADEESSSNGADPVTAAVGGVLVVGGGAYLLRRRRRRSAPA
jgi:LPXTG-motif cell wall-anchored protein